MENNCVHFFNIITVLVGSAGSGKTSFLKLFFREAFPELQVRTVNGKRQVRVVKMLNVNGSEWQRVTPMHLKKILAKRIASQKATTPLFCLEPEQKPECKSPLSGSSPPKTETPQIVNKDTYTTTHTPAPKDGEKSLVQSTTEEDSMALIKQSSGSEAVMEVNLIHLVDSGGQPQFHEVFPIFLRRRYAYIFVTNLSETLNAQPNVDDKGTATYTNLQSLRHCIRIMLSQRFEGRPSSIFMLGTHKDLEHMCSETRDQKNSKLAEILLPGFENEIVYFNVGKKELVFPVNAKLPEQEDWKIAEEIKRQIIAKCSPQPDLIPLQWFALENAIKEKADALKRSVLSKTECFDVARRLHFDRNSFRTALKYLDEINCIFYYPDITPNVVFTESQVLLDKVIELVKFTCKLKNQDASIARDVEFQRFQDHALVTSKFLKFFDKHYVPDLFTPCELVKLFRAILILADFSSTEYFMPCLLEIIGPEEVAKHRVDSSGYIVPLVLYFSHGVPPIGIFCSLVVYLLSSANKFPCSWELVVNNVHTPVCLYRNCVKFKIPLYPGTVTLVDSFFFFEVHLTGNGLQLCSMVHNAVCAGLKKAAANLGYSNSQPKLAFLCPCHTGSLHPANVSLDGTYLICTQDPEIYREMDTKQQMWLQASCKLSCTHAVELHYH